MRLDRRHFLRLSALSGGALALGPAFWRSAYAAPAQPGPSPYGAMSGTADANGVRLPAGFASRIVARSSSKVASTGYTWHSAPDGGACFATGDGGWVYVSNSEMTSGGASALRFDGGGAVVGAYRSPDGRRLYFSSQRGTTGSSSGGITFEVTGPFR